MQVYIAAPWVNKADALIAQEKFEAAGIGVTSHWIKYHSDAVLGNPKDDQELVSQAVEDVEDIIKSDVFVILNLGKSEGKATELGIAYALGMPIILVGNRDINIFYYLPHVYRTDSVEKAIEGILEAEKKQEERDLAVTPTGVLIN
jgi:nucleoside 2-deoxyribosyltransferase